MVIWYFELMLLLLLQLQYYYRNCSTVAAAAALFPDIKLSWIIVSQIYQFSVFTSLAWLPLQLQLQWKHFFESMLIIKLPLYKFYEIEFITYVIIQFASFFSFRSRKICSCSCSCSCCCSSSSSRSTCLYKFKISNDPFVLSLLIIND